jgi:hypothetical protein
MRFFLPLTLLFALLAPLTTQAQTSEKHIKQVYDLAIKYNDANMAVAALYHSLAEDTSNVQLKDSLATLYFNMNRYPQVLALTTELMAEDRSNLKYLEMRAIALQA